MNDEQPTQPLTDEGPASARDKEDMIAARREVQAVLDGRLPMDNAAHSAAIVMVLWKAGWRPRHLSASMDRCDIADGWWRLGQKWRQRFQETKDELDRRETQLRNERERLNEALAENVRRLGEITGLRTKAKQAWSEGHAAAVAAGCDSEDEFRANLGVLLVAEEQRCQLAINEEPLNPHLHGKISGLQRARDIVTGNAFPALGLDQDGSGER